MENMEINFMEWISVKKWLPNHDEIVLITNKNYYPSSAIFLSTINDKDEKGFMWMDANSSDSEYYDVTHWMPLPSLPKD